MNKVKIKNTSSYRISIILDNVRYIISGILLLFIVIILVKCTGEKEPEQDADTNADPEASFDGLCQNI